MANRILKIDLSKRSYFSIKPYSHLTPAQIASAEQEKLFTLTEPVNVDLSQQLPSYQGFGETAGCG
ncbi:MAG TPA: hypothetical protein VEG43_04915 [Dehalococcoidia bacterium]|nr:hypothetical protein [Dehalococcoidia bacterium]